MRRPRLGATTTTSGSGPTRAYRVDDPVDEPPPEQRVQVLRRRGLHPRAETRGHHDSSEVRHEAGAPGFEPGITGPKPAALPLGYAPSSGRYCTVGGRRRLWRSRTARPAPQAAPQHLATPIGEVRRACDPRRDRGARRSRGRDRRDRDPLEDEEEEHDEDRHGLRGGCDPREVTPYVPAHVPSRKHVEAQHDHADHEHGPTREVGRRRDDDALDHGNPKRDTQAALP